MTPTLIYCYDAYCGWCYGFSPVLKKIAETYKKDFFVDVYSGGMMIDDGVMPIEKIAPFIQSAYKRVEQLTGIEFGQDFLWHINNPDKSDWVMNSLKPAVALCIYKEYYPNTSLDFASDLQYALNYEGRDLDDDEAYRHLLEKYNIPAAEFYAKLHDEKYIQEARYEFAVCKQLSVDSFPQALLQTSESKFYLLAKGFTPYDTIKERIEAVLKK